MRKLAILSLLSIGLASHAQENTNTTKEEKAVFKTPELFNFDLMLRAGFESEHQTQEGKTTHFSSFKMRDARLNFSGKINDNVGYRLRFRANRDFSPIADGSSVALDYAYLTLKTQQNKNWLFTLGKQVAAMGSYELINNPIKELILSDFCLSYSLFLLAARADYSLNNNHTLSLQLHNTTNVPFDKLIQSKGMGKQPYKASELSVGIYALWNGHFFHKKFSTMWSYNISQFAKGHYSFMIGLGNQYKTDKQTIYLDLGYSNQEIDYSLGVSKDINNSLKRITNGTIDENIIRKNAVYKAIVLRLDQKISTKWDFFIKGSYETAGAKNNIFSRNLKEKYTYSGAIQYKPLSDGDLRLFIGYVGQSTNYQDYTKLPDYNDGSLCLGFFYNIPILRAK